ncbi:BTAD domain-containing putative transcriptional regulator [Virgisporangium ochraceum]|uniref:SARP family transcriptional regulator n=1 Tax=Virgisporangium ochraceum TaxID=65505 RepID=A0A8J4EB11_9ACTN|nr:BTAD domain-containing putative transcriptional regulator [Virgisporangium ochraceum]GIJ67978.1 SARP family transcriptional regulator [Virgisporangium ochraceum]
MEIRVLGPLEVVRHGRMVHIARRQVRTVLGILAFNANRPVSLERLIDLLWGANPPQRARSIMQTRISQARSAIGLDATTEDGVRLDSRIGGYILEADTDSVDILRFRHLLKQTETAPSGEQTIEQIRAALALWRGPLLGEETTREIADVHGHALESERLTAVENLLALELRSGKAGRIVDEFLPLVRDNLIREPLVARFLRAMHQAGRSTEALKLFDECRRWLATEFGTDPGEELRLAHQELLSQAGPEPALTNIPRFRPAIPKLLPADVNDFTGRATELAWVADLLLPDGRTSTAVIAIAGPGGVGKTALAVHIAHMARAQFPDGQLYVDLHADDDRPPTAREVLGRFLRALGVDGSTVPESEDERAELYRDLVADRRILVILDNAHSDSQVAPLLPAGRLCAVVVTSRARLGATLGATPLNLDVLDVEDATRLLQRMIGSHRAADADVPALCDLVGRLPLAVRIVGAKLAAKPHWTVDWITDHLRDEDQRLNHLVHEHLDVRASIAVSYRGLDEVAQRTLRILSDTPGPIYNWQVAAALDTATPEADLVLDQLVDAYLLDVAGSDATRTIRYRLHDLVRLFASERARIEDPPVVRKEHRERVHAAWLAMLRTAHRAAYDTDHLVVHGDVETSLPAGVGAAIRSQPLDWFQTARVGIMPALRQADRDGNTAVCWNIAVASSGLLELQRAFDEWHLVLDTAMSVASRANDVLGQASLLHQLGKLHADRQMPAEALRLFERSFALFKSIGHRHGTGVATAYVAMAHRFLSHHDEALDSYIAALDLLTESGDVGGQAHVLRGIGQIHLSRSDLAAADSYFQQSLELCRTHGPIRRVESQTRFWLGNLRVKQGRLEHAREQFTKVLVDCRDLGDITGVGQALRGLSQCHLALNEPELARATLLQALELAEQPRATLLLDSIRRDLERLRTP